MQTIAELLGYTPIDIHSHLDHGVPGDYSTVTSPAKTNCHIMHPAKIPQMPAFADKYPNMKLIIAHLGSNTFIDAVEAAKHKIYM